ncbi:MAG TPA: hypothetical protein GXX37_07175 [Clostridiaceae bacterium]|nr:hypothetical protein [Clostridiaceae bacterium]
MELFNNNNSWFKGNLHTHTKLSDGVAEPHESMKYYKDKGYNFLAITDHRKLYKGYEEPDFLLLSGIEFDVNDYHKERKAWHIVGIGLDNSTSVEEILQPDEGIKTPQYYVDSIKKNNGIAILAHPAWSLLTHYDVMNLKGNVGFEVWNTVSDTKTNRGDSTIYVDLIAKEKKYPLIFAADDTHFYDTDLFGGYIMVNSESLSKDDILKNILKGNFYCSQGPEIKQIIIEDNEVFVWTSPVESIMFMTDTFYCHDRVAHGNGKLIEEARYKIRETDTYVRIECKDKNNKRAWSQIISLIY